MMKFAVFTNEGQLEIRILNSHLWAEIIVFGPKIENVIFEMKFLDKKLTNFRYHRTGNKICYIHVLH